MAQFSYHQVVSNIGTLLTTHHWYVVCDDTLSGLKWDESMVMRCTSADVPQVSHSLVSQKIMGHTIKQAGETDKSGSITLSFAEGTDQRVLRYFEEVENRKWHGITQGANLTGNQDLPYTRYKWQTVNLNLLDPRDSGGGIVLRKYVLCGVISSLSGSGISLSQDAGVVNPSITFDFDDFYIESNGLSDAESAASI